MEIDAGDCCLCTYAFIVWCKEVEEKYEQNPRDFQEHTSGTAEMISFKFYMKNPSKMSGQIEFKSLDANIP